MKYRLVLLAPAHGDDGYGDETPGFKVFRTVAAERVRASGHRSDEAGEHFADYRAEFNIRDAHPVEDTWRVRESGMEYAVVAVIPNRDRGMKTLICERVNK